VIEVEGLTKVYHVPVKAPGLLGSVRSIVDRKYRDIKAVDGISFQIEKGEKVGFLGPNGAGKTTTLKMLTGLLHPTSGRIDVAGHVPKSRATAFLRQVTLVMGQKQQLIWDLPPMETFHLNRALFDVPKAQFDKTLDELVELLDIQGILDQPARNLSLGQRMRCELATALLHSPNILFLDEPTIGLDVQVQVEVRRFILDYQRRTQATVMLTSHDMDDVAAIVDRVILIDKGCIRFDGSLEALARRFGKGRRVVVRGAKVDLESLGFAKDEKGALVVTVAADAVNEKLSAVLRLEPGADVTVTDPPLEEALTRAFGETAEAAHAASATEAAS
jgi:ABC-2 type transport system ATP-binding protein